MLKGLVGSKSLTREDMDSVLEKMKDHLIGMFWGILETAFLWASLHPLLWLTVGSVCLSVHLRRDLNTDLAGLSLAPQPLLAGQKDGLQVLIPFIWEHMNNPSGQIV